MLSDKDALSICKLVIKQLSPLLRQRKDIELKEAFNTAFVACKTTDSSALGYVRAYWAAFELFKKKNKKPTTREKCFVRNTTVDSCALSIDLENAMRGLSEKEYQIIMMRFVYKVPRAVVTATLQMSTQVLRAKELELSKRLQNKLRGWE